VDLSYPEPSTLEHLLRSIDAHACHVGNDHLGWPEPEEYQKSEGSEERTDEKEENESKNFSQDLACILLSLS
jgi:hypothetical protein